MKKTAPAHLARPSDAVSVKVKKIMSIEGEFKPRERLPNEVLPSRDNVFERPVWDGKVNDGSIKSL